MKKYKMCKVGALVGFFGLLGGYQSVSAALVSNFNFEDSLSSVDTVVGSTTSDLSMGAGLPSGSSAFGSFGGEADKSLRQYNGMGSPAFSVGNDLSASLAGNDYFTFSITANTGSLDFDTLTFDHYLDGTFSPGLARFHVLVDADNNGFDVDDALQSLVLVEDAWNSASVNISGLADLAESESLEFRIYLTDSGLSNFKSMVIDNLVVNATAVPEPAAYALFAGLLGLTSVAIRRRR